MNVALLSKSDAAGGGASRVAEQLARWLRQRGHQATQFVGWSSSGFSSLCRPLYGPRVTRALITRAQRAARRSGFPDYVPFELPVVIADRIAKKFDIVHVHDLSSAISPFTVRHLARRTPTFWTLHDCSPFTGGCLYPMGCERYRARCGTDGGCPRLGEWPLDTQYDRTGIMQSARATVHRDARIHCLTPSRWMAEMATGSSAVREEPAVIANGVDTDVFAPSHDRVALRYRLSVPSDRRIVLLSAGWLDDPRKGVRPAIAALHAIADLRPFVILVGAINEGVRTALGTLDYLHVGFVRDEAVLAQWYAAADVFLFCSLADNQPLSILETMACGVSMVGYATGGIPEIVDDECGALVPAHDTDALASALRRAVSREIAKARGAAARRRVIERFGADRFVDQHLFVYERALADASNC